MVCENCNKLRKKIKMLEKTLMAAQEESWSHKDIYREAFYGTGEFDKPDKEFAEWFRKRWDLDKINGE